MSRIDPAGHAAGPPRVARVHISMSDNPGVRWGQYASIAHADAMLDAAYAAVPPPDAPGYDLILASVIWTDSYELSPRIYVTGRIVREAQADGGLLRHALLRAARAQAAAEPYRGFTPDGAAIVSAAGREAIARIEADSLDDEARRNASAWSGPSLLPNPMMAIAQLRDRFAARRRVVAAFHDGDGPSYPATRHADVRYVSNRITVALQSDLRSFDPTAAGVIWNHWRVVRDTIETLLRKGDDSDEYADNEGFWNRQLPALARMLDDARAAQSPLRNANLRFRFVGRRGEPYPTWVAELRGQSGVYVIRAPGDSGEREIVYVGSSSTGRLHETLTRHFQRWRRWKGFWRGQYGEGHDPGLTYERDSAEAAVIVTPAADALDLESQLIATIRPRDNILGQPTTDDWFVGTSNDGGTHARVDDAPF